MAGVPIRLAFQIVLVFWLSHPERARRNDLGGGLARPEARSVDVGHGLFGHALPIVVEIEDARTAALPKIVALAVRRCRVVDRKKKFQDLAIADLARVKHDLERLCVRAMVAVGGVGHGATGVESGCSARRAAAAAVPPCPRSSRRPEGGVS